MSALPMLPAPTPPARHFRRWLLAISLSRAPVTMAPLALVLAGRHAFGSYAAGALLAAMCSIGQALGTLWRGPALDRRDRPRALALELLVCAGSFGLLAVELAVTTPLLLTAATAVIAGSFGAAVPGGFLARLPAILASGQLSRGLTVNAIVLELNWVVGPLIVMGVALAVNPVLSVACIAASLALSAGTQTSLPAREWSQPDDGPASRSPWRIREVREIYALALAVSVGLTLVDTSMPALLAGRGLHPELAAVSTGAPALASVLAGLLMLRVSERHLDNRRRLGALLLCLLEGLLLMPLVWVSSLVGIGLSLFASGLTLAPMNALWSQSLQAALHTDRRAEGFALLYASLRLGVGAGAGIAAALLVWTSARSVIALAGAAPTLLALVLLVMSWSARRREVPDEAPPVVAAPEVALTSRD
ncbi:MAG: hypothetical protein QOG99_247 [Frankiales bacterium]|nr:hypothetical protein [Frankiales bacterium]